MEKNLFKGLSNAEEVEELNPLAYNPDDYPEVSEMLDYILTHSSEPPVEIDINSLANAGEIKADTMDEYLGSVAAGSSSLKEVIKNPAGYFFYMNDKANFKEKKKSHFELGTFAHLAFLEPKLFDMCVVEPTVNLATTDGVVNLILFYEKLNKCTGVEIGAWKIDEKKAYLQNLKSECKFVMIQEEHKLIIDIIKRNYYQYAGGIIPMILKGAINERSFYAADQATGIKVKVRPDSFNIEENIGVNAIISFKTTASPTIGKFIYDAAKFQYELSEGMYQEVISQVTGRKFNCTIMIMLQTVAPYLPAVFWWDGEDLQNGKYKYRYALDTVKECEEKRLWPGFESLAESGNYGIINMHLPEWSKKLIQPIDIED
jgi:hypothetical protein